MFLVRVRGPCLWCVIVFVCLCVSLDLWLCVCVVLLFGVVLRCVLFAVWYVCVVVCGGGLRHARWGCRGSCGGGVLLLCVGA